MKVRFIDKSYSNNLNFNHYQTITFKVSTTFTENLHFKMNKFTILFAVICVASLASAVRVKPQERLYFSIPLGSANNNNQNTGSGSSGGSGGTGSGSGSGSSGSGAGAGGTNTGSGTGSNAGSGTGNGAGSGSTGNATPQLNIIPMGQALGNLLAGFFGGAPQGQSGSPQLTVMPFGQFLGVTLQNIFGSGWTPQG
ncbi:hypothetical protein Ocin01_02110 [Orchesella cincta]|uniref:Uncharacterized protein n=1 Tax=Orchesella cincta TaxID=48709 RepID=A0A1D2NGY3_ORCCI|nr:hypothetical protein Ocin01_02110 [Orchesella cincta]